MITREERMVLRGFLSSREYQLFEELSKRMIQTWKSQEKKKDTEFDTVWNLAYIEGRCDGLSGFLNELEKSAHE